MQMRWNYPFLRIDQTLLFETSNFIFVVAVAVVVVVVVVVVPVRSGRCYCSHWQRRSFVLLIISSGKETKKLNNDVIDS